MEFKLKKFKNLNFEVYLIQDTINPHKLSKMTFSDENNTNAIACVMFASASTSSPPSSNEIVYKPDASQIANELGITKQSMTLSELVKHTSNSNSQSNSPIFPISKPITIPILANKSDDSFLMDHFSAFHQFFASSSCVPFSVIITDRSSDITLCVRFEHSDEGQFVLYDPKFDSTTRFLSVRGLQLHVLASFARRWGSSSSSSLLTNNNNNVVVMHGLYSYSGEGSGKMLEDYFSQMRKKEKLLLIAKKREELEKLKSVSTVTTPSSASPDVKKNLDWLVKLENEKENQSLNVNQNQASVYDPMAYASPPRPMTANTASDVLTGSIEIDGGGFALDNAKHDTNLSIANLTALGQSIRSPSISPKRNTTHDTNLSIVSLTALGQSIRSPSKSPKRSTRVPAGVRDSITETAMLRESLGSTDENLDDYGMRAYELLLNR